MRKGMAPRRRWRSWTPGPGRRWHAAIWLRKSSLAHGGARFARSLVTSGLIDEYRLAIHPVILGQGQPLFAGLSSPADLRLLSVTPFSSGAMAVVYQPA